MGKLKQHRDNRKNSKRVDYIAAFQEQAGFIVQEAEILQELINNYSGPESAKEKFKVAHEVETEADEVLRTILKGVEADFITPIERPDLIDIATSMDEAVDTIEDVIRFFYMYCAHEIEPMCFEMADLFLKQCICVQEACSFFNEYKKPKQLKECVKNITAYEEEIDKVYTKAMHELFEKHEDDPVHLIKWKSLYGTIEDCSDTLEHVAHVLRNTSLKNG